jgi:probable F420-dependent oxidoreductase
MRFGVQLPTYWQDYGTRDAAGAVVEAAQTAEAAGYASVWCNDHVISGRDQPGMGHILEPLITLASLIHLTPRLTLGTSVLVLPQRNAIVVAKQVAALDVLSGGRCVLGVGVGWNAPEFAMLNADFDQRGAIGDEAIELMRTLWRAPLASHAGDHYKVEQAHFFPKPPRGAVPIWIGGNTAPAIRRAARLGDAWSPYGIAPDAFAAGVSALRAAVQVEGQAEGQGREMPLLAAHLMIHLGEARRGHVQGTPAHVAAVLRQYQTAGLAYLICGFEADSLADYLRQVRVFAEQVIPQLGG